MITNLRLWLFVFVTLSSISELYAADPEAPPAFDAPYYDSSGTRRSALPQSPVSQPKGPALQRPGRSYTQNPSPAKAPAPEPVIQEFENMHQVREEYERKHRGKPVLIDMDGTLTNTSKPSDNPADAQARDGASEFLNAVKNSNAPIGVASAWKDPHHAPEKARTMGMGFKTQKDGPSETHEVVNGREVIVHRNGDFIAVKKANSKDEHYNAKAFAAHLSLKPGQKDYVYVDDNPKTMKEFQRDVKKYGLLPGVKIEYLHVKGPSRTPKDRRADESNKNNKLFTTRDTNSTGDSNTLRVKDRVAAENALSGARVGDVVHRDSDSHKGHQAVSIKTPDGRTVKAAIPNDRFQELHRQGGTQAIYDRILEANPNKPKNEVSTSPVRPSQRPPARDIQSAGARSRKDAFGGGRDTQAPSGRVREVVPVNSSKEAWTNYSPGERSPVWQSRSGKMATIQNGQKVYLPDQPSRPTQPSRSSQSTRPAQPSRSTQPSQHSMPVNPTRPW